MIIHSEKQIERDQRIAQLETGFASESKFITNIIKGSAIALGLDVLSIFGGNPEDASIHMSPLAAFILVGAPILAGAAYVAKLVKENKYKEARENMENEGKNTIRPSASNNALIA